MSSRALRKLHGDTDIAIPALSDEESEKESGFSETGIDSIPPGLENVEAGGDAHDENEQHRQPINSSRKSAKKKKGRKELVVPNNPFDLLVEDEDVGSGETAEVEPELPQKESVDVTGDRVKSQDVRSKTKKKKKKRKNKAQSDVETTKKSDDDFDKALREVNEMYEASPGNASSLTFDSDSHTTMNMKALLTVEHRNLNPDNEMRRMFGSRVVQAEHSRRRGRGRGPHKNTWLTKTKDTWPPSGKTGLSMTLLESRHGCQYFAFEHSHHYQATQVRFWEAVESMNPQNIMDVQNMHPYHIDSLLQLSEIFKMSEDVQTATDLIERALYSFECAFHPLFSLTQGNCRLDYRRPENRAFYIALFRHLIFIGQRGCYRTALEFCKLLLSLDPDGDPLCVLLLIDFYALRSGEFSFLIRMYQEWEDHRNLSQLPNFSFSVPLAMYHQAMAEDKDTSSADEALQTALLRFPSVLMTLLDRCSVVPDPEVTRHAFVSASDQAR